jgi:Protein of unknown function (DUF3300)
MTSGIIRVLAGIVGLISLVSFHLGTAAGQPVPSAPPLTAAQLDRLVAPIALYPDPLLAQILMAATYPLEVVEADRWLRVPANAALKGDQLTAALQQQPWDPSVKSLLAFPGVLRTMDDNLDWTVQLGDAFLAQQADPSSGAGTTSGSTMAASRISIPATSRPAGSGSTILPIVTACPIPIRVRRHGSSGRPQRRDGSSAAMLRPRRRRSEPAQRRRPPDTRARRA